MELFGSFSVYALKGVDAVPGGSPAPPVAPNPVLVVPKPPEFVFPPPNRDDPVLLGAPKPALFAPKIPLLVLLPPPKGEDVVLLEVLLAPKPPNVDVLVVVLLLLPPNKPPDVLVPKAGLLPKPPPVFDPKPPIKNVSNQHDCPHLGSLCNRGKLCLEAWS